MRTSYEHLVHSAKLMINHRENVALYADLAEFICELERARVHALVTRDIALCRQLHAPEYQLISVPGRMFTRERYLGLIESGPFYARWTPRAMSVRVSERMAIVRYEATLQLGGEPFECWHTDSWELIGEHWKAVWSQGTKTSAPTTASD